MSVVIYIWRRAPFLRLLPPFIGGITAQWYLQIPVFQLIICAFIALVFISVYSFLRLSDKYRFNFWNGVFSFLLLFSLGALMMYRQDVRNEKNWLGHSYQKGNTLLVRIEEPLIEKERSFKADASTVAIFEDGKQRTVSGKIILYMEKDSAIKKLHYGSLLLFSKPLTEITNSGNPGAFDYKRFSIFKDVSHSIYLKKEEFTIVPGEQRSVMAAALFSSRKWVIGNLRKYIQGSQERGLAEALLIGYKDDLEKDLVQAYSNTGVVHIIAISGLHLGLIYLILMFITRPLQRRKKLQIVRLIIVVCCLWCFAILAGAQPSVLRAATMFTFIGIGTLIGGKNATFNTLALSAFALLMYNPFWLWSVGFQLSYAAVASILIFYRPVYNWIFLPNKADNFFWQLIAVTLSAQVFTLPISIYYFHQMPLLFLLTNIFAVPIGSFILILEIALSALFFIPPVASIVGVVITFLIALLNGFITWVNAFPHAVWSNLYITFVQAVMMLFSISFLGYWLLEKKKFALWMGMVTLCVFFVYRSAMLIRTKDQDKLIVYNVPSHTAVDIISGNSYYFVGDTALLGENMERNFHLQPSRILHRASAAAKDISWWKDFRLGNNHILIIDSTIRLKDVANKEKIDLLLLSKNPKLYISELSKTFLISQLVIDGSVPEWKAALWQRDADSLHIPCYDVKKQGAFVMNVR